VTIERDTEDHFLVNYYQGNELTLYWNREGQVLYRDHPLRGAHAPSFRFYLGSFAKDRRSCYCTWSRLAGADPTSFRALNFAYAKDDNNVWTMGGKVKDADAESFIVCDDGFYFAGPDCRVPHGFGKDKAKVFYEDFVGKAKWVRKADPETFVSLNDGYFARDGIHIFCGPAALPKAIVAQWRKIGGYYSTDGLHVYYLERLLPDVHVDSFAVVSTQDGITQLAKDQGRYFWNDRMIDLSEFERLLAEASR
jgi:hypothetical protein